MVSVDCPTAQAMLNLSRTLESHPVEAYLCSWTAFESIARLVARQSGLKPQFNLRKNAQLKSLQLRLRDKLKMRHMLHLRMQAVRLMCR